MKKMTFWTIASTLVSVLWWYGGKDDAPAPTPAPETASAPAASAPTPTHRFTLPEIRGVLQAGSRLGDTLYSLTAQDVCALAVAEQEGPKVAADFATCATRHGELDLGLLIAGHIAGEDVLAKAGPADICGMFGMAALRADLSDLQRAKQALPADQQVVDHINAALVSCEKEQGKNWTVQPEAWEQLGSGVVLNKFYPKSSPAPAT